METSAGAIIVKAYLEKPGQSQPEIRRFNLEEGASTSFEYLSSKLNSIYPSLPETSYDVYWKDEEGDLVAVGSDDELIQALLYGRPQGLLKLYLRTTGSTPTTGSGTASGSNAEHPGVVCDGCEGPVVGLRFKCMVCPDYDLCGGCCDKGLHNHHYMLRMNQPATDWAGRPCGAGGRGGRSGWWWPGYPGSGRHGAGNWNPRRFWKQFMRGQWQNGESQAAGGCQSGQAQAAAGGPTGGSAQNTSAQQQTDATAAGQAEQREFLEHVGHQVSAILEPFGIAVDVEERPYGYQAGGARGRCGRSGRCKPDPQCKKNHGECAREGKCQPDPQCQKKCAEAAPTVNKEEETTAQTGAAAAAEGAVAAEPPQKEREETDMDSDESSWIKVEPKPDDMDVIVLEPPQTQTAAAPSTAPSAPPRTDSNPDTTPASVPLTRIYPSLSAEPSTRPKGTPPPSTSNPPATSQQQNRPQPINDLDEKVFQAVNQMKAMGFHDEGGWMTAMLYQNNGEIYRVIDSVLKAANNKKN